MNWYALSCMVSYNEENLNPGWDGSTSLLISALRLTFFVPTDPVKIKGTGLGLNLVRMIAKQHGGAVRATSEGPGKGSTMYLRLPLARSGL